MRVLVAFDMEYVSYRDVIEGAIKLLRPHAAAAVAEPGALATRVADFDPHLVICDEPETTGPESRFAWVELSPDPDLPTKIRVGGRHSEVTNPTLDVLLRVIDETEQLVEASAYPSNR